MAENEIHIGKLIEQKFNESGMTKVSFARKLHYERNNIYNIFKMDSINTKLLYNISNALHHDFFQYYSKNVLISDTQV